MEGEEFHISSESIKHLIFREEPQDVKFPIYISKFNNKIKSELKKGKLCHQTMGLPADFFISFPCEFLKKRTNIIRRPDIAKCVPAHQSNMSPVPKHDGWKKEKRPDPGRKNYLAQNIAKIANAVPKTGPSRYYDQATNQRYHDCILTAPKFSYYKLYGKVPKYIKEIKKHAAEKKRLSEEKREFVRPVLREVSQEDRKELLDGLKRRWTLMQKDFQLLPMLNDTPPQIKRKLKLEKGLEALEKEIEHIERNQLIFIYDSPQGYCEIK